MDWTDVDTLSGKTKPGDGRTSEGRGLSRPNPSATGRDTTLGPTVKGRKDGSDLRRSTNERGTPLHLGDGRPQTGAGSRRTSGT